MPANYRHERHTDEGAAYPGCFLGDGHRNDLSDSHVGFPYGALRKDPTGPHAYGECDDHDGDDDEIQVFSGRSLWCYWPRILGYLSKETSKI